MASEHRVANDAHGAFGGAELLTCLVLLPWSERPILDVGCR